MQTTTAVLLPSRLHPPNRKNLIQFSWFHESTYHNGIQTLGQFAPPQVPRITANKQRLLQATSLRNIKALAPLLDRILVQRVKAEAKTSSGIFLPESTVEKLSEAKVVAVGPGGLDKDGKRIGISVKPGDRVLIPPVRLCCWYPREMLTQVDIVWR